MTQRYVAPIQVVSVKPDYPRYSVQEDRRKPVPMPSSGRQQDPRVEDKSSRRDFRALALLILLAALAVVVVLSMAV
jgi:hypothetical protein